MVHFPPRLWLDDRRPAPPGYLVAKTAAEAMAVVERLGKVPDLYLDHDLGDGADAPEFLRWLTRTFVDCPARLTFTILSRNPTGRLNLHSYLSSWARVSGLHRIDSEETLYCYRR